jgi:hypothetical protein
MQRGVLALNRTAPVDGPKGKHSTHAHALCGSTKLSAGGSVPVSS